MIINNKTIGAIEQILLRGQRRTHKVHTGISTELRSEGGFAYDVT